MTDWVRTQVSELLSEQVDPYANRMWPDKDICLGDNNDQQIREIL